MDIITLNDLSKAISNRMGIQIEEARRTAGFVLDIFGYNERVIDNILGFEDRQLFYLLESEGILTTGREVTILHNGREWLTHYWELNKSVIRKFSREGNKRDNDVLSIKRKLKK